MKKLLLSFLSLVGWGFSASAQSHINIELLGATYTTTPAVQFRVSWNAIPVVAGKTHNSKIWLWVDFRKIENNQPSGTWTRATVASPSPGTVTPETDKGFWLQGNSGSYSQIVTVALTNITPNTQFNWCAYASDCPPFVVANNGTYTLRGTPPFILRATGGASLTVEGNTLPASSLTIAAVTLTDKTECPSYFCAYTGSDLLRDETHLCGHRTAGAQNWEAYIKDSRDDKVYRIIQMPNSEWWLADYLDYEQSGITSAVYEELRYYAAWPTCPANWTIWSADKAKSLFTTYGGTNLARVKSTTRWSNSYGGDDYYGLCIYPTYVIGLAWSDYEARNDLSKVDVTGGCAPGPADWLKGITGNEWSECIDPWPWISKAISSPTAPVRCFRTF